LFQSIRIKYLTSAAIFFVACLTFFEIFQLFQLYERKRTQIDVVAKRTLEKIVFRHEKSIDYQKFKAIVNQDFSSQYRKILEYEFGEALSTKQEISIQDTTILINNKIEPYLVIRGTAKDSLSGVKTEQVTLIKDVRQLQDFFKESNVKSQGISNKVAIQLNQKLLQHIFKKAKFVNELMLQAFKENVYESPQQRINLSNLDSIIQRELKNEDLPKRFTFCVLNEQGEVLPFARKSKNYSNNQRNRNAYTTHLFPTDLINENLTLRIAFPTERGFILGEMKVYILITLLLFVLMIFTMYIMIKTIIQQRKLSEMKSDFISNMTHEFKTPISTISLACEALNDKDIVPSQVSLSVQPYVKMIKDENKRLENLVEGILQSAVLNKGDIKPRKEEVNLVEIIEKQLEVVAFTKPQDAEIKFCSKGLPCMITADKLHTTNLIANLIDNAIKYRKENLIIEITLDFCNKPFMLHVKDNGIGIDKSFLPKIFDKLYRVPTGNVHNVKGFGLGLSYVKAICDAQGWEIQVLSTEGLGTEFIIKLND
jgi:two-component system phosphate regulon sensor histidine kinase PhoR